MNPHLVEITSQNTSEATLLNLAAAIWANPVSAKRAGESAARYLRGGAASKGPFFLIRDAEYSDVGLIGTFWHEEHGTVIGLRWSGVVPAYRGRGVYRGALTEMVVLIKSLRPDAQWLEELLPPTRPDLIPFYEKLAYEDWGTIRDGDDPHFLGGRRMRLPINGTPARYCECGKGLIDRFEGIFPGRS